MAEYNQRFKSYEEWVNKAPSWLTRNPSYDAKNFRPICFDSIGEICRTGKDFMRARDRGTFPVHWVWPNQIPGFVLPKVKNNNDPYHLSDEEQKYLDAIDDEAMRVGYTDGESLTASTGPEPWLEAWRQDPTLTAEEQVAEEINAARAAI